MNLNLLFLILIYKYCNNLHSNYIKIILILYYYFILLTILFVNLLTNKKLRRCFTCLQMSQRRGYITVGYRGSFAFGREGLADVKFRKLSRILVCGRVALCRDVFGETLNESRDPDHGMSDRYTSRFFLKHSFIEQAFDMLQDQGFKLVTSCGSATAGGNITELKPGVDFEENRWNHYNEFVFERN
jgi:hypothetical protein